jgi:hypothetical protein
MTNTASSHGAPAGSSDRGTLALIGLLGTVLVAGYVVLSALGKDTTGYLLFLGGPAVSAIVGGVLSRRVSHVQDQVVTTAGETQAVVVENVDQLANHIHDQDVILGAVAQDARVARLAVAGRTDSLPVARPSAHDQAAAAAAAQRTSTSR